MSLTKFISLLQKQALFFARADKLADPFEGSFSRANLALRPAIYKEHHEKLSAQLASFIRGSRRFTLINCWHENPHESEAMWRLYGNAEGSIAIKSDCKSLIDGLIEDADIYVGRVNYVDYDTDYIPENNAFYPYVHKRHSFQHEREVRAIVQQLPAGPPGLSKDICAVGKYVKVVVPTVVREVVVHPYAEEWFLELVVAVTRRYAFNMPVRRSTLAEHPVWG